MTPCSNVRAARARLAPPSPPACARVVATDYSEGMLKQARKKLARFPHVVVEQADITDLHYADDSFDAVVAGNVIHLLPEPRDALKELKRVCARVARSSCPPT